MARGLLSSCVERANQDARRRCVWNAGSIDSSTWGRSMSPAPRDEKTNTEETMNDVTRYRPVNGVFAMPRDLGRLMDDVFGGWDLGENLRQWLPATDVSETPEAVTLRLEVPGLTRDQIKIAVENNMLTVRGEKRQETSSENEKFRRTERSFGSFERSFSLPSYVDTERVQASLQDGVLSVTLPRREETKAREIQIEGESRKQVESR
jgi:HSP20 family protein